MTTLATAFLVTAAAVGAALPLLRWARVVDVPNHRSSHMVTTPRGGGLGVVTGIMVAAFLGGGGTDLATALLVAGLLAMAVVGMADDLRSTRATVRLALQMAIAVAVVAALAGVVGPRGPVVVFCIVASTWVVAFTNAFNFMDGVNAISGLNAAVSGLWYATVGLWLDRPALTVLALAVAGAGAGFLPWNAWRPRVFLGDVGSYALGAVLALLATVTWMLGSGLLVSVAPLTIYVADTGWALVKRLAGRRPWQEAHREHVYQRLVDAGWPHLASAALTVFAAGTLCALAAAFRERSTGLPIVSGLSVVALYLMLPAMSSRRRSEQRA